MDRYSTNYDWAIKAAKYNAGIQLLAKAYLGKWDPVSLNVVHSEHIGPEMPLGSTPVYSGVLECQERIGGRYRPNTAINYRLWRDDYDRYMDSLQRPELSMIERYIDGWLTHSGELGYPLPMIDLMAGYYLIDDDVPWATRTEGYAVRKMIDSIVSSKPVDIRRSI